MPLFGKPSLFTPGSRGAAREEMGSPVGRMIPISFGSLPSFNFPAPAPPPPSSLPIFQAPEASQAAPPPSSKVLPMQPSSRQLAPSPFLTGMQPAFPRIRTKGGLGFPGLGTTGFGGTPTFASPIFSSPSSTSFWDALLAYRSPAMQAQMGGSYSNPFATSYFPNYYPDAYMGDPLFRMRWTSRGQLPLWMRNYSQEP